MNTTATLILALAPPLLWALVLLVRSVWAQQDAADDAAHQLVLHPVRS